MPNLNIPALYAELNNPTYLPVCIAMGKAPLPGRNGRLEPVARLSLNEASGTSGADCPEPDADCPAAAVFQVRTGEILARKLPPQEGMPGYDVFGGVLPPLQPEDITLLPSDCFSLLPGGDIVANREGRPRFTGWDTPAMRIDFPDTHVISESTTTADGTLVFAGDIIAPQGISEHSTIEALGNIYITGDVRHAVIAATGSIVIRGKVTDSHIYCGDCGARQHRLYQSPDQLIAELNLLRSAARMLEENLRSRQQPVKYGLVVLLLLEGKYAHLPGMIRGLQGLLAGDRPAAPVDTGQLKHMLEIFLHSRQFTEFINDDIIGTFLDLLEELRDGVFHMHEGNVRIDISGAEDSLLQSGGSLYIHGESAAGSTLLAAGNVGFLMAQSVCCGSKVEAGQSITLQLAESFGGEKTQLTAGLKVTARQISGTSIHIGGYTAEIDEPAEAGVFTAQSLRLRNQS